MKPILPILKVQSLTLRLPTPGGEITPVKEVSFALYPGKTLSLLGESGSGKSLTALSILQLLPKGSLHTKETQILFQGRTQEQDLARLPEIELQKIRGRDIAMIFQEPMTSLNPVLKISDQIREVIVLHRKLSRKATTHEIYRLLEAVQIRDVKRVFSAYPHQLSGGMRQRVMIAMSLAGNPKILIADEPTTALDVGTQIQILNLLKKIQQEFGMSLLFITHDLKVAKHISDEIAVMYHGSIVEQGECKALIAHPKHAYTQHLFTVAPKEKPKDIEPNAETVLNVQNLKVYFPVKGGLFKRKIDEVRAVDDVSFSIRSGETLGLVGESGSGKTTLARALMALIPSTAGNITVLGSDISKLSQRKIRSLRSEFQIIFQDPFSSMDPRMRVKDILEEGMLSQNIGSDAIERLDRMDVLLEQVGLKSNAKYRFPHQFSGGERQRLCIARALSVSPQVIICDEPTSSLDASVGAEVIDLLIRLQDEFELSYLFITHNISLIQVMAHQMMVMYNGKIVESGKTQEILVDPKHEYTQKLLEFML